MHMDFNRTIIEPVLLIKVTTQVFNEDKEIISSNSILDLNYSCFSSFSSRL